MASGFKNISEGLRLIPRDGSSVGSLGGDIEVLSQDGKAYFYNASQSSSSPLVTENHSATLTNKVIDADDNTISNLADANIRANADIERSKLEDDTPNTVVVNDGDGIMTATAVLDVPRGGSGAATLTGYVKGNGTSAFTASSTIPRADIANGTANQVVINNGSGALSSEAQLDETRGGTGIGTYATGDTLYASATNTLSKLTAGSEGTVLKIQSGIPAWGSPSATLSVVSKTAAYSAQASDDVIFCNATSAAFQITLPSAASNSGKFYRIRKTDATFSAVTVSDGGSFSTTLNTQGESIDIVSDGSNWQLFDRVIPAVAGTYTVAITGTSSNPTKGNATIDIAYWYRQRNCAVIQYTYTQTVGGTAGSGSYLFSIPSGLTIDTGKLGSGNLNGSAILGVTGGVLTTTLFTGSVYLYNSTNMYLYWLNDTTAGVVGSSNFPLNTATWRATFSVTIPISGWNV